MAIAAVAFLPEIHAAPARDARVLFQDGALPVPVPGGTLWTFGDTFLGTRAADGTPAYEGSRSNTMAFLPAGAREFPPRLEYLTDDAGVARSPLELDAGEDPATRRLWPLAGVWLGERGFLFYAVIDVTGAGPWGFRFLGAGLARSGPSWWRPFERLRPRTWWPMDPSAIVQAEGMLYLYAPRRFHGEDDPHSGLLIGRVREEDIEDPLRYEFFAGLDARGQATWVPRVEEAETAAEDVWGQASVAWNAWLGEYLLATSSNFQRPDRIQLRESPTPWGPWRPLAPENGLIRVPELEGETTQLVYCTMLHPELDRQGGRVIALTFCRMLEREWTFTNPEAVRVELERAPDTRER